MKMMMAGFMTTLAFGAAAADRSDDLTVTGSRFVASPAGITYSGLPLKDVSLSYGVTLADLDLGSTAGLAALDKRVVAAARAACAELGRLYPVSNPDTAACTRETAEKSIAQVHRMLATARTAPAG